MSKNNKYSDISETLGIENRSFDNLIFLPKKPVLDSELTGIQDIQSAKIQDIVRSKVPSGWLNVNFSLGLDDTSQTYGINTTTVPNVFYLNSHKQSPFHALVNGWLVQVGGTDTTEDNKVKITLPEAPASGSRSDLVFLEVWKAEVKTSSSVNKPASDKIYKYGNTEYGGVNLDDEIQHPQISVETTQRVQIQYRIRIVSGVDFSSKPEGVNDPNTVWAQGAQSAVTSYTFENAGETWDDYGLYVAGDGSTAAAEELGTVDGYVYAVPMFRIHRRNKGAFSVSNQNGAAEDLLGGNESDRPDGLFYDQIHMFDLEDLRHAVSFDNFNYQELHDKTVNDLYSGELRTSLTKSQLDSNLKRTNLGLYVDKISNTTQGNTELITKPNGQQRYFSDVANTVKNTEKRTINDKTVGVGGGNWLTSDEIQIDVNTVFGRASAVIGSATPVIKYVDSGLNFVTVTGSWADLGTDTATFTLGTNAGLTDEDLFISYDLEYSPLGDALSKPITDMLLVDDLKRGEDWGFISVNDFDESVSVNQKRRERVIPAREIVSGYPDYAFVYRLASGENTYGIGTLYSYYIQANGATLNYTIPATVLNSNDAGYVYAVYNVDTSSYITLTAVQRNGDGSLTVTLPSAYSNLLRFDVALLGGVLEYDERTQSIVDIGRVEFFEIMGNGTDEIVLKNSTVGDDPNDLIIGVQREYRETSPTVFESKETCYVNGIRQLVDVTVEPDSSLIKIQFAFVIPTSQKITVALLVNNSLDSTENINMYYNYSEYKGVTAKDNFGSSCNSFINSRTMYHRNKLDIVTSGTGAINTAETLSKNFEPLIPKLPLVDSADAGDFIGTIHKAKEIIGGSYSIDTNYNTPYASGKDNILTKEGIVQARGTYGGGTSVSAAEDSDGSIHKLIVGTMVEMVKEDGSGNFLPGELGLRVETNYISSDSKNRITNSDSGEVNNSFDMFKIEGRPLIKIYNK